MTPNPYTIGMGIIALYTLASLIWILFKNQHKMQQQKAKK